MKPWERTRVTRRRGHPTKRQPAETKQLCPLKPKVGPPVGAFKCTEAWARCLPSRPSPCATTLGSVNSGRLPMSQLKVKKLLSPKPGGSPAPPTLSLCSFYVAHQDSGFSCPYRKYFLQHHCTTPHPLYFCTGSGVGKLENVSGKCVGSQTPDCSLDSKKQKKRPPRVTGHRPS